MAAFRGKEWADQCVRDASLKETSGVHAALTDAFLTAYISDTPASAADALHKLRSEGSRQVCQYQFRKNDIVWICKQCQRDETCVLCNDCFPFSSHEGHEVFFYHSQAGGCCDCGDPGAWDPCGFCHRHGRVTENPMNDLPPGILSSGKDVLTSVAECIETYFVAYASAFNIKGFLAHPPVQPEGGTIPIYEIILNGDDIHSNEQLDVFLSGGGFILSPLDRQRKIQELSKSGATVLTTGSEETVSRFLIAMLALPGAEYLSIGVRPTRERASALDEEFVISCISWLYKLAEISDGMCALICSTFTVERLRVIMTADCRLTEVIVKAFHGLLLTLMADISFKKVIAAAYALALPQTATMYGDGVGKADNSIFRVSVQFLNRYVFVKDIVEKYSFLENLANGLLVMMNTATSAGAALGNTAQTASSLTLKHHVIKSRRYDAILGDMKIIFILPAIPKLFCMNCLSTLLAAVETVQYIDPQVRQLSWHVEYESDTWVGAFNIHLSFASLFDALIGWFGHETINMDALSLTDTTSNSAYDVSTGTIAVADGTGTSVREASSASFGVSNMFMGILLAIYTWHRSKMTGSDSNMPTMASIDIIPAFTKPPIEFSFHLLFHRFFASCIKECCRFPQHIKTLSDFAELLGSSLSASALFQQPSDAVTGGAEGKTHGLWWFYALADYPMQNVMTAAQIKLKMWARNGVCMLDQLLNYTEFPFCRIFRDLDVLLIQYCGVIFGSRLFLQHIYNRFNVHSLLANKRFDLSHLDPPKSRQMLDEALLNIIIFMTELPLPPMLSTGKSRGCSMDARMDIDNDITHSTTSTASTAKPSGSSSYDDVDGEVEEGGIDDAARCRVILRREVLHRLMAGACNYSQLYECRAFLPGPDKSCDDIVDDIVREVGVVQKSGGVDETVKIYLNAQFWTEYDPCFFHVTVSQHQNSLEHKPKVKVPTAICPAPPEAHDSFVNLRQTVLMDPLLLGYIRELLYSFVALRFEKELDKKQDTFPTSSPSTPIPATQSPLISETTATTATTTAATLPAMPEVPAVTLTNEQNVSRKRAFLSVLAVTKPWVLQCTDSTYLKLVQLLTLLVHHLEYMASKPLTEQTGESIEALSTFVTHCPHSYVPEPLADFLDSATMDPTISANSISSLIQQQVSALSSPGMSGANTPFVASGMNSIYASQVNSSANSANNSRRPSFDGIESLLSGGSTVFDYSQPANVTGINVNFVPMQGGTLSGLVIDSHMSPGDTTKSEYTSDAVLPLPSLLGAMLMAHDMLQADDDSESKNYMRWCLDKLRVLLPVCDKIIVDWMKHHLDNERDIFMKAKRIEAKARITKTMQAMTDAFINSSVYNKLATGAMKNAHGKTSEHSELNSEGEPEGTLSGVKRADGGELSVEDDECIICRGNSENAGTMAYLVHSHVMKHRQYELTAQATAIIDERMDVSIAHVQTLPPPPPITTASSGASIPGIESPSPVLDTPRVQEGCPSQLIMRFCGHAMHQSCFDAFYPQVVSRSSAQQGLLLDTNIGEFQCPLCKMLNNAIIPVPPTHEPVVDKGSRGKEGTLPTTSATAGSCKVAKLGTSFSDLDGIDCPTTNIQSHVVWWLSQSSPQGVLLKYVYPSSLCLPVNIAVPCVKEDTEVTSRIRSRSSSSNSSTSSDGVVGGNTSWLSRTMSSFPMRLFDTRRGIETEDSDRHSMTVDGPDISIGSSDVNTGGNGLIFGGSVNVLISSIGGIPFALPRPDDISMLIGEDVLARQINWARFLTNITEAYEQLSAGQMKDDHVLSSLALTLNGSAFSIALEATESYPGCHLMNKASMGMDQLKAIRGVVDVVGLCLDDFHVSKGLHTALMAAITGDPINVLWMADNSIPLSSEYKRAALQCVESAMSIARRDSLAIEPLVLTVRRAIQLQATLLGRAKELNSTQTTSTFADIFLQPLLARPLLDSILLAIALHRSGHTVISDNRDIKSTTRVAGVPDDIVAALTAKYFERSSNNEKADECMHTTDTTTGEHVLTDKDALIVVCKWLIMASLSQLVAIAATKNACDTSKESPSHVASSADETKLPLEDLVVQLYSNSCSFIAGNTTPTNMDAAECPLRSIEARQIILDWLHFIRTAIHVLLRCHYDACREVGEHLPTNPYIHVFNYHNCMGGGSVDSVAFLQPLQVPLPEDLSLLTDDIIISHLAAVDLLELFHTSTDVDCSIAGRAGEGGGVVLQTCLIDANTKWLNALVSTTDAPVANNVSNSSMDTCRNSGINSGINSCDMCSILEAEITNDTISQSLLRSDAGAVRSVFVSSGFLGFMGPDWACDKYMASTNNTDITIVTTHNSRVFARRLGLSLPGQLPTSPGELCTIQTPKYELRPLKKRKIYTFPRSYTMFHQQIRARCSHEYPAVCLICGVLLNAGGKAECTKHVSQCSGNSGAFFLLQDCQVLLCYHSRASYFPAPFIDDHGERHRQYRGKPLHLDEKRYEVLRNLIATGGIANEVVQKRSTSQRVIIANHY